MSFSASVFPTNHGLPTVIPSDAAPAISPSFGELLPLPPTNIVSFPNPSCRACSNTPDTGSTSAEMPIASGFKDLIFVSCALKSVSFPAKLSIATIPNPAFSAAAFIVSNPDLLNASSFAYISAIDFTPCALAYANVTGITSLSGRLVRNTYGPISVIPAAVVLVPTIGIFRSFTTGPTANISFDKVGPMIATTLSRPISFRAALIAWSLLAALSSTVSWILRPPSTPLAFTSSSASSSPALIATPYAAFGPLRISIAPICTGPEGCAIAPPASPANTLAASIVLRNIGSLPEGRLCPGP